MLLRSGLRVRPCALSFLSGWKKRLAVFEFIVASRMLTNTLSASGMLVKTRRSEVAAGPWKHSSSTARAQNARAVGACSVWVFARERTAIELRFPAARLEEVEHAHEQVDGGEDERDHELRNCATKLHDCECGSGLAS